MGTAGRHLLGLLPKIALSRTTGALTRIRLPRGLRGPAFRWFAKRYGANPEEAGAPLDSYRSFDAFFRRSLADGARPIAESFAVSPCDGRIVHSGAIENGRIVQVKGVDYSVGDLLEDSDLARPFENGSQTTIYLAPGDYHRVHSPFGGTVHRPYRIRGTLYPVHPYAVSHVPRLFVRNARTVFPMTLDDGRAAAVVMVGALNVGARHVTASEGAHVNPGDELGQFGFGSTTIALLAPGEPALSELEPETRVLMGQALL